MIQTARNILIAALMIAALGVCVRPASAQLIIQPGFDLFETNSSFVELDLPAGFFGTKSGIPSDPIFIPMFPIQGLPTGPMGHFPTGDWNADGAVIINDINNSPAKLVGPSNLQAPFDPNFTDTIVERLAPIVLPTPGSTDTVEVELVALSLRSVDPIQATYAGSAGSFFDIYMVSTGSPLLGMMQVTLDSVFPVGSNNVFQGTISFGTNDNGIGFDPGPDGLGLPVIYDVQFQNLNPGDLPSVPQQQFVRNVEGNFFGQGQFQAIRPIPAPAALPAGLALLGAAAARRRRRRRLV